MDMFLFVNSTYEPTLYYGKHMHSALHTGQDMMNDRCQIGMNSW